MAKDLAKRIARNIRKQKRKSRITVELDPFSGKARRFEIDYTCIEPGVDMFNRL